MKRTIVLLLMLLVTGFSGALYAQDASSSYDTAAADKKPTAGYDGGFFIQSDDGKYNFKMNSRLDTMAFWEGNNKPDNAATTNIYEDQDIKSLRLRRAYIGFGTTFNEDLTFSFSITASQSDSGFNATYWADGGYTFFKSDGGSAEVDFGMIDLDYDMQSAFSSKRYMMVDFPIVMTQVDGEQAVWSQFGTQATTIARPSMGLPSQVGLKIVGSSFDNRFKWALGFGNGAEETAQFNRNWRFIYAARLAYVILGDSPYSSMNDYSYSETPVLAIGAAGAFESDPAYDPAVYPVKSEIYKWSADATGDLAFRWKGFAVNLGGYYRALKVGPAAVFEAGEKYLSDVAYMASASMFAVPKKFEVFGWAAQIFREGPDNNVYEFGGGANYYFAGVNVKLGADYSRVVDYDDFAGANHGSRNRIRAKLQLVF